MLNVEEMKQKVMDYCGDNICPSCLLKSKDHCYTKATEEEIVENYNILVKAGIYNESQPDNYTELKDSIHTKGYIYDSLMYRYQLAREKQVMWEINKEKVDPEQARQACKRDVIRFAEILDEAIGEHD